MCQSLPLHFGYVSRLSRTCNFALPTNLAIDHLTLDALLTFGLPIFQGARKFWFIPLTFADKDTIFFESTQKKNVKK